MENQRLKDIKEYYSYLLDVRERQSRRFNKIAKYSDRFLKICKSRGDKIYYSVKRPCSDKFEYAGDDSKEEIRLIKEAHYLAKSLAVLDKDIALLESFLNSYESFAYRHINSILPKPYRGLKVGAAKPINKIAAEWKAKAEAYKASFPVIRPEEKIHTTLDGTKVRSKSEQLIYNYLFLGGFTFVYELPLKCETRLFYPDFTILSEIDYKTEIRIEHQGKYGDAEYRAAAETREYEYWSNGFLPSRDVYFTYDDNKGGFDIDPIVEIVRSRVRPTALSAGEFESKRPAA